MSHSDANFGLLPDLGEGVPVARFETEHMLRGRVGDEEVLLVRTDLGFRAVQAHCPHYGAPLAQGCVYDDRIYCPWHRAAFDLDDGSVCRPPALDPLKTWPVETRAGLVRVTSGDACPPTRPSLPRSRGVIVVVGAGAGGTAALVTLREAGHAGPLVLIEPEAEAPYDRPNLSKDFLEGTAPEEWLPLRSPEQWRDLEVKRIEDIAVRILSDECLVETGSGKRIGYDGLVLATGSSARRLGIPGTEHPHVHTLRSLKDCRALLSAADAASHAVVVGAGFLGLEAASALRSRGLSVDVIAPEEVPLMSILGTELGMAIQAIHREHGVRFHMGNKVARIDPEGVVLKDGTHMDTDLVLLAVGAFPRTGLAESSGLMVDDGVVVDSRLRTSEENIYAVGDIARFPHPSRNLSYRVEHWAVAASQGRVAALNLLGHDQPFQDVPFLWTRHFGTTIQWAGYPGPWDHVLSRGSPFEGNLCARFMRGGKELAVASVGCELEGLRRQLAIARDSAPSRSEVW